MFNLGFESLPPSHPDRFPSVCQILASALLSWCRFCRRPIDTMERQNAVWEAPTDTMDAPHAAGKFMLEVSPMAATKTIRIIKKIQQDGAWRFVTLARHGSRYEWDSRPGTYCIEWWEGARRRREVAGSTPSEALAARRRQQGGIPEENDGNGETRNQTSAATPATRTPIPEARKLFLTHIAAHSPDKPETVRRYSQVLEHFERLLGSKALIESYRSRRSRISA